MRDPAFGSSPVLAGKSLALTGVPANATIAVSPGTGGTMKVEYRVTKNGPLRLWPASVVSAPISDTLLSPVFQVVFTATTVDGLAGSRVVVVRSETDMASVKKVGHIARHDKRLPAR